MRMGYISEISEILIDLFFISVLIFISFYAFQFELCLQTVHPA